MGCIPQRSSVSCCTRSSTILKTPEITELPCRDAPLRYGRLTSLAFDATLSLHLHDDTDGIPESNADER